MSERYSIFEGYGEGEKALGAASDSGKPESLGAIGFTPGPWEIGYSASGYPYTINAPSGNNDKAGAVGTQVPRWGAFMLPSSEEALANAHLIASAPELLDALKYARRFLKKDDYDTDYIDSVIAKATGTAPALNP
jgi:hypothetical protein